MALMAAFGRPLEINGEQIRDGAAPRRVKAENA
jgi:hypothetical protein